MVFGPGKDILDENYDDEVPVQPEVNDMNAAAGAAQKDAKNQEWVNLMTQHYMEDQGQRRDQDCSSFRQLRALNSSMKDWYEEHGGRANPHIWDTMTLVTPDGGVRKRLMYPGPQSRRIQEGESFIMQYTAYVEPRFSDPIDSTRDRDVREVFRYQAGELLVHGIYLAVGTMNRGETSHFRMTSEHAFGAQGVPPRIPPGAVMHYVIEIRDEDITDRKAAMKFLRHPDDDKESLGYDLCRNAACELRGKGVAAFKRSDWERAAENFDDGLRASEVCVKLSCASTSWGSEKPETNELLGEAKILSNDLRRNAAVAHKKLRNWELVKTFCADLLIDNPKDIKAIYCMAHAQWQSGNWEEAWSMTKTGIKLRPSCPEFAELYAVLVKQKGTDLRKEKVFCQRMFASAKKDASTETQTHLVSEEVRQYVAAEVGRMKNSSVMETPLKHTMFVDRINLTYLQEEAGRSALMVTVTEGKTRKIIRLTRKKPNA